MLYDRFLLVTYFIYSNVYMATHSRVLAWRIPGTGEPGGLLSMGSHRVGHDWSDLAMCIWQIWGLLLAVLRDDLIFYLPDSWLCIWLWAALEVVGCLWNACVCNLHLPTLFGKQCKSIEKKSKGNYYVANCVITLFHSPFFSIENDYFEIKWWDVLMEKQNHLCCGSFLRVWVTNDSDHC